VSLRAKLQFVYGSLAERFKAPVLKTGDVLRHP